MVVLIVVIVMVYIVDVVVMYSGSSSSILVVAVATATTSALLNTYPWAERVDAPISKVRYKLDHLPFYLPGNFKIVSIFHYL